MEREGPPLETLLRRLAETPEELFAEPRTRAGGRVHVAAVVADLFRRFSFPVAPSALVPFAADSRPEDRNRLSVTLLLCWVFADDSLLTTPPKDVAKFWHLLEAGARELAGTAPAKRFTTDAERREELVRLGLARVDMRPAGETAAQAQDRLASLNSAERARLLEASRLAEKRARQIREALARKAAEEAADKWTRE